MKKIVFILCTVIVLAGLSAVSRAGVHLDIGVSLPPPPPPLFLPAPPDVYVIPGTYAYFPPAVDVDIIFYSGYWYRPYQGYWYRSASYNGKWTYIDKRRLPRALGSLRADWRNVPPGHRFIPYGKMKQNWRSWEREKYWDKHHWKHEEKERRREYKEHRKQEKHNRRGEHDPARHSGEN